MSETVCPQCGAPIDPMAFECRYCGERMATQQAAQRIPQPQAQPQVIYQQPTVKQIYVTGVNPAWPVRNKIVAGLLGIFLGSFGIHKFYLGRYGMGILYILFCWTWIPGFIGFIEGIVYLCSNDENFQLKHHVRLQ